MARTSRKNTLTHYRSCLEHAVKYRDQEQYDALWERMIDLYRGKHAKTTYTQEDQLVINVAFATINVIYPSVSVNHPKIVVAPNHPDDEDRALFTEAITNYQWRHFNFQDPFRRAVKDYLVIGHGWLKVGWKYEEAEESIGYQEQQDEYGELVAQADEYAIQYPQLAASLPTDEEIVEQLPTTKTVVKADAPYVERVSPRDMFVDPEATCMDDAIWVCQRIVRPIADVKRDPRYKPSARARVQPDSGVLKSSATSAREWKKRHARDPNDQRVTIWEWWDLATNTYAVFAEDGPDEFLVDPMPSPFACGHPYEMLRNYDVPEYFYPMGDLEALECLQQELNALRTIQMGARHTFARKLMIRPRAFGPQARAALESKRDLELVEVNDESTPFADLIGDVPRPTIPPEIYQDSELIEKDIGDVSGVSEYQRGQVPETRRTATEAAIISDSVNARAADKLAQIEIGMSRVARKVVAMNAQFISQEMWARVTGPEGGWFWVPYDRDDVQGEYDFEVEAGSTQPRNETVRRQEAQQLSQAMDPYVQAGIVDPRAMAKHLLSQGFGIRNPDKFLMPMMPMVDPMTGLPMDPAMGGMMGGPPGADGMQPPPMGGGYPDAETGVVA